MNEKLLELEKEVKNIHNKIVAECSNNTALKELYKGCQIFLSPFRENADVMLIGINPGDGYARNQGRIVEKFEPLSESGPNKHDMDRLGEEVQMCFRNAGKADIFDNAVVTNAIFFATSSEEKLSSFKGKLPVDLRNKLKAMSAKWTRDLINIVNPKMIMCLGHGAFDYLRENVGSEMVVIENKKLPLEAKIGNIPVIACKRRMSTIINKDPLIERLQEYMKTASIIA